MMKKYFLRILTIAIAVIIAMILAGICISLSILIASCFEFPYGLLIFFFCLFFFTALISVEYK